jgi:hypothetical protein
MKKYKVTLVDGTDIIVNANEFEVTPNGSARFYSKEGAVIAYYSGVNAIVLKK